ncbi:hypothetical protein JCM6882_006270 [Rhodosporidiobolus microsporus]
MTPRPIPRTFLRLSPSGRWVSSPLPYNLQRHPAPSPGAVTRPRDPQPTFPTLASDATPVPSLQAAEPSPGVREATSEAGAVDVSSIAVGEVAAKKDKGKRTFLGVELPVKPSPPEEGECCMSGCAHCVYDLYLEDLEVYHSLLSSAKSTVLTRLKSLHDRGSPVEEVERGEWPEELGKREEVLEEAAGGGEKGAKGGAKDGKEKEEEVRRKAQKELEKAREGLDPTMRAFLEMEAKMKAKQQAKAG